MDDARYMYIHPYTECLRSHSETIQHATSAHLSNESVMGVKGPSPLLGLQDLNIVDGFVVYYMHCVHIGVTRFITAVWLDSVNHSNEW